MYLYNEAVWLLPGDQLHSDDSTINIAVAITITIIIILIEK